WFTTKGAWVACKRMIPRVQIASGSPAAPNSNCVCRALAKFRPAALGNQIKTSDDFSGSIGAKTDYRVGKSSEAVPSAVAPRGRGWGLAIYAPHGIEVDAFLHNAFDKAGQISATTTTNEYDPFAPVPVVLSQPRTLGVRLTIALGNPY